MDIAERSRRAMDKAKNPSEAEIQAVQDHSWNRYLDDYDERARADFDAQFQRDLDALENSTLKPLGQCAKDGLNNSRSVRIAGLVSEW